MQRRMALAVATAALSVPLLAVGGLAIAADHVRPDRPASSQLGDDRGAGTEQGGAAAQLGTPAPAPTDDRMSGGGDRDDDHGTAVPHADDSTDDHGCDDYADDDGYSDDSDSGSGCTASPGHHDDHDDHYDDD
jgi:hypothetical protein